MKMVKIETKLFLLCCGVFFPFFHSMKLQCSFSPTGLTPLHLGVIQGNSALVNLLIANKANVNAIDNEGHSVVHWAAGELDDTHTLHNTTQLCLLFISFSVSPIPSIDSCVYVYVSISHRTVCGEVDALRALLAAGADVTITDLNGGSPVRIHTANFNLINVFGLNNFAFAFCSYTMQLK